MADAAAIHTPFVVRYRKPLLGGLAVVVFFVAYMFSCAFLPQFEEMISEARRQRYVRT